MATDITAVLVLQNGQIYSGQGFGTESIRYGECVFTTGMTGYSESLTDPSYAGQILCFASPLIGNIGTSHQWYESENMYADGLIVSSLSEQGFHSESNNSLEEFLNQNNRGGIQSIDTRQLVKTLRDEGNQPCVLIVGKSKISYLEKEGFHLSRNINSKTFKQLFDFVDNAESILFRDWADSVSKSRFDEGFEYKNEDVNILNKVDKTIVVLDCGVKLNILRELSKRVSKVVVLKARSKINQIMKYQPDGILLSNGPGDPRDYDYAVQTVKGLLDQKIVIMGICLGHQLLSLAIGCEVYKMKFGNRGANQPVQDLTTGKAYLTSQNHGYATKSDTIPADYQIFFQNLNDHTVEGIIHKTKPIFSVQFHPEACGGPQDTNWLFDKFINSL
jgi:carbamoyl-phosphate synthase small subunit